MQQIHEGANLVLSSEFSSVSGLQATSGGLLGSPPPTTGSSSVQDHDLALGLDSPSVFTLATGRSTDTLENSSLPDLNAVESNVQQSVWAGRTRGYRPPTVEDAEDEDGHEDGDVPDGPFTGEEEELWERLHMEERERSEYEAISVWDKLAESFIREGLINGEDLSEEDLKFLRPFALKVKRHMSGETFAELPLAFPDSNISTWKQIQARAAHLSGFQLEAYDCCINSCCAFTGPHASESTCPYCTEARHNSSGQPRKTFVYLPIIPRLKSFLANKTTADAMQYRGKKHEHIPGTIVDVMDSENYRSLLNKHVTIDGRQLDHTFFGDVRDIALGLSTDGFAPFKRRTKTAWPLILFNYNLRPEIRNHLENILGLGVIPGPKKLVDFDSFLWPLVQELLHLSVGVHAYDSLSDSFFALWAYLILVFGDIPVISMVMCMKGHNGVCPCRMCMIRGVRIPDSRNPIHYVPLDRACHPGVLSDANAIRTYDPSHLPLRSHADFLKQAKEVQFAPSDVDAERLAKQYSIKGVPILSALSSLSFPSSFPYDFMHLIWENVIKNLVLLWAGKYKDLDQGSGNYQFPSAIWDAIGTATADSGDTLPYMFGPCPPNVASDKMSWTADTRSFWMQYIAPVVLRGRFLHDKYYNHFVDFVRLINLCLGWEITTAQVQEVRDGFVKWVQQYEDLYYQHDLQRLSTCPLTIHALLHIADSIRDAGPVFTAWAFLMERYCGALQPAIRSRRFSYSSLNRYVVDYARLTQLKVIYGAYSDVLSLRIPSKEQGKIYSHYDTCRLLPSHSVFIPDCTLIDKVVSCLSTRFDALPAPVRAALPKTFQQWAKLKILPDGDTIRAAEMETAAEDGRDATFVRYELLVDRNARYRNREQDLIAKTFWGQLRQILVVELDPIPSATPPEPNPQTLLFAVIRTCTIETDHNVLDIHYYKNHGRTEVVDLNMIQCCVGWVKDRGQYAIVDRSGPLAWAVFVEE